MVNKMTECKKCGQPAKISKYTYEGHDFYFADYCEDCFDERALGLNTVELTWRKKWTGLEHFFPAAGGFDEDVVLVKDSRIYGGNIQEHKE